MNSRELREKIDIKRPRYQSSKREVLDTLALKGSKKGEFLSFGPYYEIYMYSFFIGYNRKERLPLIEEGQKDTFLEIGKWKPQGIVNYILLLMFIDKDIIKYDWCELEDLDNVEIDNLVSNVISSIEEYANAGLAYLADKIENDKMEFTDPFVFINILNEVVDKAKEKVFFNKNEKIPFLTEEIIRAKSLIDSGENEKVEFKSTLRFCLHQKRPDKKIEHSAMKTIAAFLNSYGGSLFIGVDDNKNILGLENDFSTLKKSGDNKDEFRKHLDNLIENYLGNQVYSFIKIMFHEMQNKTICEIKVAPNKHNPSMLKNHSKNKEEEFYIRRSASSKSLSPSEMVKYINNHWDSKN